MGFQAYIMHKVKRILVKQRANRKGLLFYMKKGVFMSKRKDVEAKTEELVMPLIDEKGFEFVDTEFVKEGNSYYLKVFVDKPGGITIDDLESVSRPLSDKLDEHDFIDEQYILEVSSPGLGRPMKKDRDFDRNMEKVVEIHLYKAQDGEKEWVGQLKGYNEETVTIEIEEGNEMQIERANISLAREYIEF